MYRYIKSEKMNLEPEKVRFMCLRTVCARKHKHQSACKLLSLSGFREMTGGSNLVAASLMRASEAFVYKDSEGFCFTRKSMQNICGQAGRKQIEEGASKKRNIET